MTSPARIIDRSCGPSGCEVDWLTSERHEAPEDVTAFTRWAAERGWGDGLPLIPPTEGRVRAFLARCDRFPDEIVAELPPLRGECTVEKIAVNAVMAGADPAAMPLIIAAIEAMSRTEFNLAALNATTGSVVPAVIVNGPVRDELAIPYEVSCLGGAGGGAPAISDPSARKRRPTPDRRPPRTRWPDPAGRSLPARRQARGSRPTARRCHRSSG